MIELMVLALNSVLELTPYIQAGTKGLRSKVVAALLPGMKLNPLVPTDINISDIKMKFLYFNRLSDPKHKNHISFHFGGNAFDLAFFWNL